MTLVAAAYTVALRYTRTTAEELYFSTTAVCITEVIKLLISVGLLAKETGSLGRFKASLSENVLGSPKELAKLSVPSLVYAVQNNMAFLALSNLDAAVYQVTYQLKIPCTALCTVLMLNRTLSKLQWISVFMLCGGVTLVQWKPAQATKVVPTVPGSMPTVSDSDVSGHVLMRIGKQKAALYGKVSALTGKVAQNPLLGFGAIAIAVLCSGFAGVYFEKVLKSSDTSLWVRNIQMYLSGIVVTLAGTYLSDGAEIQEKGFFYGYTYYVWFVIFLASVGGLYTSVVVKYTDNIMKGFSAAAAIVLSTIASVLLFGLQITLSFALGALLVCVSIYLYGLPRQDTTSIQQEATSKERIIGV
ncbi:CMP-sialic acid transporter isoform 2 [Mus musculus]|nr:CMP-sialic acid transporter isoform 2 [Mus musculus]